MNEFKAFQSIQIAGLLFCNLNLIVKTPINEKKRKKTEKCDFISFFTVHFMYKKNPRKQYKIKPKVYHIHTYIKPDRLK